MEAGRIAGRVRLPALSAACGWAVRRDAFEEAGGFDEALFMQGEELGLACRLLAAGWSMGRIDAVAFDHRKSSEARRWRRVARLDLRNNLCLSTMFLNPERAVAARPHLVERYGRLLAAAGGTPAEAAAAVAEADAMAAAPGASPLAGEAAESLFGSERQREAVAAFAAREGLVPGAPVTLAGFTKHADLTREAAVAAGLAVVAVVDAAAVFRGCRLGGVPVVSEAPAAAAVLHTDLNPGRPRPPADPSGRPTLFLRDAYPAWARPAGAADH